MINDDCIECNKIIIIIKVWINDTELRGKNASLGFLYDSLMQCIVYVQLKAI